MQETSTMVFYVSLEFSLYICMEGGGLEEETSQIFTHFLQKIRRAISASFQRVCRNDS